VAGEMAQAAKLNKDEADRGVNAFSLMEPVGKLAAYPRRLRLFLHDVRVEMKQVHWPSRDDVVSTTIVVTVTVAFFGIYFFMTDSVLGKAISWLIEYAKKH
jgi:preprotein translocase subunit SecE